MRTQDLKVVLRALRDRRFFDHYVIDSRRNCSRRSLCLIYFSFEAGALLYVPLATAFSAIKIHLPPASTPRIFGVQIRSPFLVLGSCLQVDSVWAAKPADHYNFFFFSQRGSFYTAFSNVRANAGNRGHKPARAWYKKTGHVLSWKFQGYGVEGRGREMHILCINVADEAKRRRFICFENIHLIHF